MGLVLNQLSKSALGGAGGRELKDYLFYRLNVRGAPTTRRLLSFKTDAEAIRRALAPDFPEGCDLWEEYRLVGRFYGPTGHVQAATGLAA